jgi:DNA topoisomerase-2
MPIWSFTQERLDRLKEQITKKKAEHDELQALSEKDLWCKDLDDFADAWENQLRLDAEISTGLRRMSRYKNRKGTGRGRKPKGDDDFMPTTARSRPAVKSKVTTAKPPEKVVEKKAKPAVKSSLFSKNRPPTDGTDDSDPFSDGDLVALKKKVPVKEEEEEEESVGPVLNRTKRAAAAKAKSWVVDDDESESDDDDKMLDDVGDLVKGVGNNNGDASDTKTSRLGLLPMSRPESSHGDSATLKFKSKPSKASDFRFDDFDSNDDTNYEMLAKSSPHKRARNDDLDGFLSDDDLPPAPKLSSKPKALASSSDEPKLKPKPAASLPAAKKPRGRTAKPKDEAPTKKTAAPKATQLSPAAKAYAAKKAKPQPKNDDFDMDDDEDGDELEMDDPESPPPRPAARGRPGRAAATKSKPVYVVEDEDDDDSMDDFVVDESE